MKADCDYATLEIEMENLYNELAPIYIEQITAEIESEK
jgi:hypothetical protein